MTESTPGLEKPPSRDRATGIHYLGTSVHPPGEHAGAAALSGRLAAEEVLRGMAQRPASTVSAR